MSRDQHTSKLFERIAPVGFGGAPVGNFASAVSDAQAQQTLTAAWNGGLRYFDTAPHYGLGLSERRIGHALQEWTRSELVLSTKVGRLLEPRHPPIPRDDEGFAVPGTVGRVWDFTLAGVRRSIDESLDRLNVSSIDIVLAHDPDQAPPGATAQAVQSLIELKREGTVAAIGIGTNSAEGLRDYLGDLDVILLAGRHNLLNHQAVESLLEPAMEAGTAIIAAGIFASGILASSDRPDSRSYDYQAPPAEVVERVRAITRICREHNCSLPQAAIAFPQQHPAIKSVLIGMRSELEVRANLAAAHQPPPEALWRDLVAAGLIAGEAIVGR